LNGLDNLGTRPRIRLVEKDLGAWRRRRKRKRGIVICRYNGARGWGKGFVSASTIGRSGFKEREIINFMIGIVVMVRIVSRPAAWAARAARAAGVKPEGVTVEISDRTTRFAVVHGKIPLAFEILYLLIAGSELILCPLKRMFECVVLLCEFCCI
jgi:hypothetical protein